MLLSQKMDRDSEKCVAPSSNSRTVRSHLECAARCKEDDDCTAFTFDDKVKKDNCHLRMPSTSFVPCDGGGGGIYGIAFSFELFRIMCGLKKL